MSLLRSKERRVIPFGAHRSSLGSPVHSQCHVVSAGQALPCRPRAMPACPSGAPAPQHRLRWKRLGLVGPRPGTSSAWPPGLARRRHGARTIGRIDMTETRSRRADSPRSVRRRNPRRWVKDVTSHSTRIPPGLFTEDAVTIARTRALPRVSPEGPVSGLRMLSFFINRAGRQLSHSRRAELEKAKRLMRQKIAAQRVRR